MSDPCFFEQYEGTVLNTDDGGFVIVRYLLENGDPISHAYPISKFAPGMTPRVGDRILVNISASLRRFEDVLIEADRNGELEGDTDGEGRRGPVEL